MAAKSIDGTDSPSKVNNKKVLHEKEKKGGDVKRGPRGLRKKQNEERDYCIDSGVCGPLGGLFFSVFLF